MKSQLLSKIKTKTKLLTKSHESKICNELKHLSGLTMELTGARVCSDQSRVGQEGLMKERKIWTLSSTQKCTLRSE
jgi:hypothetical protein